MLQKFHPDVTKYLTLFSKNQFQTFSYIHTQKFKESFKVELRKTLFKN